MPPACRPECVVNSDCGRNEACGNQKCRNPCPGTCGVGARCEVVNHNPICSCPPRYTGDPFVRCRPIRKNPKNCVVSRILLSRIDNSYADFPVFYPADAPPAPPGNPCIPSPCGPNSQCRVAGESPSCSCLPDFLGTPPNCRPECVSNSECATHLACINQKCKDPCPGTCGANAMCRVVSHTPQCVCPVGFIGDPFVQCTLRQCKCVEQLFLIVNYLELVEQ